jgi:SAM-dependent methyltransferase
MSGAADKLSAFWNRRYAADGFAYGTEPNDFLVSVVPRFKPGGTVLCLADGEGRNGVWLARQGFAVTSVDIAARGMEKAREMAAAQGVTLVTQVADLAAYDLGRVAWDAIVSIFVHLPPRVRRDLHARCVVALHPGGLMAFEAYGPGQLGRGTGGPPEAALLPALADVEAEFSGCRILHRHAGLRDVQEGRHHNGPGEVVQLLAQKPGE